MTRFDRRALLAGGVGLLAAGCSPPWTRANLNPAAQPTSPTVAPQSAVRDIRELLALPDFTIAHRGSGDNWPEHSLAAYLAGLQAGAQAVEISVRSTASGDLVCFHDADTERVTGVAGELADLTRLEVDSRPIDARRWLGPASSIEPIPRLEDVLKRLPTDSLAFIEDKTGTNTGPLLDLLDAQPNARQRFIWKQWAPAAQITAVRKRGYAAWGFLTSDVTDRLEEFVDQFDALGVDVDASDELIKQVVATGKPVVVWPVHTRSEATRLRDLGVAGLMCSNVAYVRTTAAVATRDSFGTGVRAVGDLPIRPEEQWLKQPRIDPDNASLTLGSGSAPSYSMGSMCPITGDSYVINYRFRWRAGRKMPCGLAIGLVDDSSYDPNARNQVGGYRLAIEPSGAVVLADHAAGRDPEILAEGTFSELSASDWNSLSIMITPGRIAVAKPGTEDLLQCDHTAYRGGYFWLWTQSVGVPGVEFSEVEIG